MDFGEPENILTFFLIYEDNEHTLQISEYETVEILKTEVHKIFGIPLHSQVIDGWRNTPEGDNVILQACADLDNITCLTIKNKIISDELIMDLGGSCNVADNGNNKNLEIEAACSCISKIQQSNNANLPITLHCCTLKDAIDNSCLAPLEKKKILLVYLHNEDDPFSSAFLKNLNDPKVKMIVERSYFFLGWDVTETKYQKSLINTINRCAELSNITHLLELKIAAALLIVGIDNSFSLFSVIRGNNVSSKDILVILEQTEKSCCNENDQEEMLKQLKGKFNSENDFGSVNFQNLMADMLGDRDYDSFEFDQHDLLKSKIGFAVAGPPSSEKGYDDKQQKIIKFLYEAILNNSNEIAEHVDRVEIAFIYNCVEPLPVEKNKRSKKYKDYNPNTDLCPFPIFVLRKCHGSENPCRIFVDHMGRTYHSWEEYIARNKLYESQMILPLNGRYEVDSNGNVLLETHLSPACSFNAKLIKGADYVNVAGGLVSGGVFVAATLSSAAAAPVVAGAAGVAGIGIAIYSVGRSAYSLYDRSRHKESLSFANSEARGAYLNIVAGSLGFVGAGATMAVTKLASQGVNIGKGASVVFNTISFANIGVSGASLINSGYDVFDQWNTENQTPSLLTIVQLGSSVLFFGNAVYNFKMCSTIVEESQTRILKDYQESLRSNRHRKTFTKLLKETIRQNNGNQVKGRAEVISAIRNIQNKDEVFAVLTRSNKNLKKNGIKFSASDGEIKLNGIKVDMNKFLSMNKRDSNTFLFNISQTEPTPLETKSMKQVISNSLKNIDFDIENFAVYALKLLQLYNSDIKMKLIGALASLVGKFTAGITRTLDEIFPNHQKFFELINMVVGYFSDEAEKFEAQYQQWLKTGDDRYYNELFKYVDIDKVKRVIKFFETAVDVHYKITHITEEGLKGLVNYFHNWLVNQIYKYQEKIECNERRTEHSSTSPRKRVNCPTCKGYYFQKVKK